MMQKSLFLKKQNYSRLLQIKSHISYHLRCEEVEGLKFVLPNNTIKVTNETCFSEIQLDWLVTYVYNLLVNYCY